MMTDKKGTRILELNVEILIVNIATSKLESSILLFKKLYIKLISKYFLLCTKDIISNFILNENLGLTEFLNVL